MTQGDDAKFTFISLSDQGLSCVTHQETGFNRNNLSLLNRLNSRQKADSEMFFCGIFWRFFFCVVPAETAGLLDPQDVSLNAQLFRKSQRVT
jgi:hypothetical protein